MKTKIKNFLTKFLYSYIWLAVLMFIIDIVSKNIIVHNMSVGQKVDLIPGFLRLTYEVNPNFAFSASLNLSYTAVRVIYCVIAVAAITGIIIYLVRKKNVVDKITKASLMLIITGAFGNLVDRVFYTPEYLGSDFNGVVDFIDFYGIWNYVFNWADSCLVVGVLILLVYLIVREIKLAVIAKKEESKTLPEKTISKSEQEKHDLRNNKDKDE